MDNTFLFVLCVKDEEMYQTCMRHLIKLRIPEGMRVEYFPVRGATSMTEGYNRALHHKAKYKIYLHEDTFILNRDLLKDIVHIFQSHSDVGLLGVVGCKNLPSNGVWWESKEQVGKALAYRNSTYELINLGEIEGLIEEVDALDGILMITQYDIPWREDIVKGFHFYDVSQCLEFKKKGYKIGVPKQIEPWVYHARSSKVNYEEYSKYHQVYLAHYQD